MIKDEEISVVVSGPVIYCMENGERVNASCLTCKSIRKNMPKSEIVFSTWVGEDCDDVDCDVLVRSVDPGPNLGNVNRQICSRLAGIKAAKNKYILAIRSESYIYGDGFKRYFGLYENRGAEEFHFLEHRIVIPAAMPVRSGQIFHMGDWYFFGCKDDLIKFWDLPYMKDELFNNSDDDIVYNPHRYLITSFVKKYHELEFQKIYDNNVFNKEFYEKILASNFVITGFYDFGCRSYKYPKEGSGSWRNILFHMETSYTLNEWKQLYNEYCGGNEIINIDKRERILMAYFVPLITFCKNSRQRLGMIKRSIKRKIYGKNCCI